MAGPGAPSKLAWLLVSSHCLHSHVTAPAATRTLTCDQQKADQQHCDFRCCHAAVGELQVAFRRMRAFFELLDKLGVDYWCAGFLLA